MQGAVNPSEIPPTVGSNPTRPANFCNTTLNTIMNNHFHIADRADRFIAIIRDDRDFVAVDVVNAVDSVVKV